MLDILIVEDDKLLLDTLTFELKADGFNIISATSYLEGLDVIKRHDFDLAILDVNLPDGDGFSLCQKIKLKANIPVIFLTARDQEVDEIKGFDLGADDYISKPFSLKLLKKRINVVLKRSGNCKSLNNYDDGFLFVDFDTYKVRASGKEHSLTSTEAKLLLLFIESKGIILTRKLILELLWDENLRFVTDHTLSVHINRLRTKIEDDKNKYIKTVYGVGYQWIKE